MPVEQTLYGIYIATIHNNLLPLFTTNISDPSIVLEEIELETCVTVEDNAAVYQGISPNLQNSE
jgi:hypothetical protein